jgi:type IX secretion system PorP/SprF family membrane protein
MRRNFLNIIISFICINLLNAQQLPYISAINDVVSNWNPAALSPDNSMKIDLFARQQWIGFKGAPLNGLLSVQSGIEEKNLSAGAFLYFDNTGPLSKKGLTGNFAYHLKGILSEESRLTGGISFGVNNYSLNLGESNAFTKDDPLLTNSVSKFTNTFGVGIQYIYTESNTSDHQRSTFGLSYNQFSENNLLLGKLNQKRVGHWFGHVGTHVPFNNLAFEPSISLNYVEPELSNALLNFNVIYEERLWIGVGYSTVNDVHLQGGIDIQNFSEYDANFKIGVLMNSGLISNIQNFTPGVEIFMRYQINR